MSFVRPLVCHSGGFGRPLRPSRDSSLRRSARTISHAQAGSISSSAAAGSVDPMREAWRQFAHQFVRSAIQYTACDTAVLLLVSQPSRAEVLLAGGLAYAAARWGLMKAAQSGIAAFPALIGLLQCAQAGTQSGSGVVQLPADIFHAARTVAYLVSGCFTVGFLGLPDLTHDFAVRFGKLEEVPLTGRQRPAMPAVSEYEQECRRTADANMEEELEYTGPGAMYLPADHPESRYAQEELHRLRSAADALIVEHYGAESAVAQKYAQHFAGHDIPVRVFCCQETTTAGQASAAGISVKEGFSDTETTRILAHELAHMICRHSNEKKHYSSSHFINTNVWGLGALVLRGMGRGGLATFSWALAAWMGARCAWHAASSSSPRPQPQGIQPLVEPGQLGFYGRNPLSRDICMELEAERLAMLIMARAGVDPAHAIAMRFAIRRRGATEALVENMASHAEAESDSLCVIEPEERDRIGQGWPNDAKLAQLYAEVLPQARAMYAKHRPVSFTGRGLLTQIRG